MLTLDLPRPQIFVSHSAHDGCARAVREAVVDCLRAEGFEVLIDEQQFSPGEAWRPRLDDWLHVCDGALVILTPEAAESRYVFYETTLLRNRARSQPDIFTFVPLRFSNVTDEMLIRHMDPLQLGEIQQVEVNVGATDMPMSAQEVMEIGRRAWEEVRELLQPAISRRQPRHMIEQLLIDLLFQHFSLASLHEMHKRLSLGGQLAGAKKDQCITLARALLDFDAVPLGPDRFDKLASVAPQMYACMGRQHAQTALNCIVPFCWVHPEAAKMLEQVASAERRAVAWGRTWNLSERKYLLRTFYDRHVLYVPVSRAVAWGGELSEGIAHIRSCLAAGLSLSRAATDEQLQRALTNCTMRRKPIFLGLPAEEFDDELLRQVHLRWPSVISFLYSSGLTPAELTSLNLKGVPFLEPELTSDSETDARMGWADLMKTIGVDTESIDSGKAFLP